VEERKTMKNRNRTGEKKSKKRAVECRSKEGF
jgi:hypothetical protein